MKKQRSHVAARQSSVLTAVLRALLFALLTAPWGTLPARAETLHPYSFAELWKMTQQSAPEIRASEHETEAAKIGAKRAARHWYPRIYLDFRAFETNDPALNFMSILGQRQIQAPDFAPEALNHPGSQLFERGTLGLDLPLYEGGAKSAMSDAAASLSEAKEWELKSSRLSKYTELAGHYASLLVLADENQQMSDLLQKVKELISSYRIGSKANPVGYSGLLGLKTLKNRMEGLLTETHAKQDGLKYRITLLAQKLPAHWQIELESPKTFLEKTLSVDQNKEGLPFAVQAARSGADSMEKAKGAEKARLLPRVGLFAEGNLYGGNRATATSYNSGAYLQWDLLSAPSLGAVRQAEETAAAARAHADALSERSQAEKQASLLTIQALNANLELLDDSSKLLEEQTHTARALFRNGSINALQLVEVLARRVDLLVSRADAQQALIQAHASWILNSSPETLTQEAAQ